METKEFTGVLQVALWKYQGMSELEIRQHLADLISNETINAGIKLCDYLNAIQLKGGAKSTI